MKETFPSPHSQEPGKNLEKIESYKARFWEYAQKLASRREELQSDRDKLYKEISEMQNRSLNLHERDILASKESVYWNFEKELREIPEIESKIENILLELEQGVINEESIKDLLPPEQEEGKKLSKRKQRILEERKKWEGVDLAELVFSGQGIGANPTKLTTGRHQKRIKGNFNPLLGEAEFYYRTADTHGGKVGYGKKGSHYVSASGKRVRKK